MSKSKNSHTEVLENVASNVSMEGKQIIPVAILEEQSIVSIRVNNVQVEDSVWIQEILAYIIKGKCSKEIARRIYPRPKSSNQRQHITAFLEDSCIEDLAQDLC